MMPNVLSLIANLALFEVTKFDGDSKTWFSDERQPAPIETANVSTSIRQDKDGTHALLLDLDVPAWLIPSSTEGHSHLYVDVKIPSAKYVTLLDALADAGVIEQGYAGVSKHRGATSLRLPWVKKSLDPESTA